MAFDQSMNSQQGEFWRPELAAKTCPINMVAWMISRMLPARPRAFIAAARLRCIHPGAQELKSSTPSWQGCAAHIPPSSSVICIGSLHLGLGPVFRIRCRGWEGDSTSIRLRASLARFASETTAISASAANVDLGTSFIDVQRAAFEIRAVHGGDGPVGFLQKGAANGSRHAGSRDAFPASSCVRPPHALLRVFLRGCAFAVP